MRTTLTVLLLAMASLCGCSTFSDNEGSTLTTRPGDLVTESMILGKWDLDGERTNTANGNSGVGAIPNDVFKDVFGAGWGLEKGGILRVDETIGSSLGSWRLKEPDSLTLRFPDNRTPVTYKVRFDTGFMVLTDSTGHVRVMERNKFFGF